MKKESAEKEKKIDLCSFPLIKEKLQRIPYQFAKQYSLLPLEEREDSVLVALGNPLDLASLKELRLILGKQIQFLECSSSLIEEAIEECYHHQREVAIESHSSKTTHGSCPNILTEGYDLLDQRGQNPVIHFLNSILIEAIHQGASDIHFEPQEKGMKIRYRIDGVLLTRPSFPQEYQTEILTRLKVLAKLDITEQRLPQDGRIKLRLGKREIDFRVSTIPVVYGERIVLRILDKKNLLIGLDRLGMGEETLCRFADLIHLSEGIILVSGPTGSGKTTTLYSALSEINTQEKNVMTIEDPVEYKLPSIGQIGVNPKISLTFAKGLRHILRQDPDVIMIGEIRDRETAEIAIQASLTGHLVFSTLHTNDAPTALTRLVDMGIEPYLLSSSIAGVIAQRLVRKVCTHCRKEYEPTMQELAMLHLSLDEMGNKKLFVGKGCSNCLHTGYRGRVGIFELMLMDVSLKKQLLKRADAHELRKKAMRNKMVDLFSNGLDLVKRGITTTSELLRVIQMQKMD